MAKVKNNVVLKQMTGKLDPESNVSLRIRHGEQHTYTLNHPRTDVPTEAMKQTRSNLADAQAFALAEMSDAQKLERWTKEYQAAQRAYRKSPSTYEKARREALLAAGKRIRKNSLDFPKTVKGYIMSKRMLG